ncbi:MAG: hypothetical protein VW405_02560, partial [Rhodospirillaceae bacterium]
MEGGSQHREQVGYDRPSNDPLTDNAHHSTTSSRPGHPRLMHSFAATCRSRSSPHSEHRISRDDLMYVFGRRSRLSEVMNKRRPLSVEQIRRAHFDLGLDA